MDIALEVSGTAADAYELRQWLRDDPDLRPAVVPLVPASPAPGSMGAIGTVIELLLQPGGLTVTLAAGVVAWLQTRRGTQTVTITKPDGTQVVVTSEGVRGLTPQSSGELAQQVARALAAPAAHVAEQAAAQGAEPPPEQTAAQVSEQAREQATAQVLEQAPEQAAAPITAQATEHSPAERG